MDRIQKLIDYATEHWQYIEFGKMGNKYFMDMRDMDPKIISNYKKCYGDTIESVIDIAIKALGIR